MSSWPTLRRMPRICWICSCRSACSECWCWATARGGYSRDEEIRLAQAFADQAAQAIWNARQFAETERSERQARALFEVTRRLAATLDTVEILDIVVEGTVQAMGSHAAAFYRWEPAQDSLLVERAYNFPAGLTASLRLRSGEGVAGRAHAERRVCWTDDRSGTASPPRRRSAATFRERRGARSGSRWGASYPPRPRALPRSLRGADERPMDPTRHAPQASACSATLPPALVRMRSCWP